MPLHSEPCSLSRNIQLLARLTFLDTIAPLPALSSDSASTRSQTPSKKSILLSAQNGACELEEFYNKDPRARTNS